MEIRSFGQTELQKLRVPSPVPSSLSSAHRNMQKVDEGINTEGRFKYVVAIKLDFSYPLFFPSTGQGPTS